MKISTIIMVENRSESAGVHLKEGVELWALNSLFSYGIV